jgi:hypothetical protein
MSIQLSDLIRFLFTRERDFLFFIIKICSFDILDRASDCYWKILAERARIKLDDELRENRQVNYIC